MQFTSLLLLTLCLYSVEAQDTVTFKCSTATAGSAGTMTIRFSLDAKPQQLYATGKPTTCGTGVTASATEIGIADTTDTQAPFNYEVVIDVSDTNQKDACGVTDTTTPAGGSEVTFFVKKSTNAKIITSADKSYKSTCDWNNVATETTIDAVQVTVSDSAATSATPATVNAVLETYATTTTGGIQSTTQTAQTTISLDNTCSLRVTLNDVKNKLITRGKIVDVKTSSAADFADSSSFDLVGDDGCGITASGVFANTAKFTAEATFNNANNDKFQYKSDDFDCFRFVGTTTIHFRARVIGCLETEVATTCAAPSCPGSGRKRRDVSQNNNRTTEVLAVVRVLTRQENRSNNQDSAKRDEPTVASCVTSITFLSIIAVLSVLLLVTLGVTIFFGAKAMRRQGSEKSILA